MRKGLLTTAMAVVLVSGGSAGCDRPGSDGDNDGPKIGVILPDSASSARWETADRKYLAEAFRAAGVAYDIQNAQGDKTQFQTIADQMITGGVTALMIVNLDSGTGKAVLNRARNQGVPTIDYDRLTLGGSASYYVSFDNEQVGRMQGEGLVKCLEQKKAVRPVVAYLNGAPTDNNASLLKSGYESVLNPLYGSGRLFRGPAQDVPDWDNTQAGTIFEQMMTQTHNRIDGVIAANDGVANAAIAVLRKNKINGKVAVTGQDATVQGLQNILSGDQCMTVYKTIRKEAEAAAELAIALARGERKKTGLTVRDSESGREVPSVLLQPQLITKENVGAVLADGYVTRAQLCADTYAALCTQVGIG